MRDQHDTQTSDLMPAKRGRPCKNPEFGPMSTADRARAYRNRKRARAGMAQSDAAGKQNYSLTQLATEYSDLVLLEAIRKERAFLESIVTGPQKGKGAAPSRRRLGNLVAELAHRYPIT